MPINAKISKLESQANEFALAFLMPKQEYVLTLCKNITQDIVDTSAIAKHFHVTIETASTRGKSLGYLKW